MKKVQAIVGRLVQCIAGTARNEPATGPKQRPVELDSQMLKHVAGGSNSTQTPNKGW